jgi:uncharacterized repeat protein (TIGR03806 family)
MQTESLFPRAVGQPTSSRWWISPPALVATLVGLAWIASAPSVPADDAAAPPRRPAWTASRFAGMPDPPPPYRVELAFPHLTFKQPLDLTSAPGSDRLFVVEFAGQIHSFVNDPDCRQADLLVDLKLARPELTAMYALTFHPDFANNRHVYVCYVTGADKPDGTIISRFEVSRTDPPTIDPTSEHVVFRWWAGGHNGCALKFGPDGYLYISTGDGGGPTPPDPLLAGQDVTNVLSSILRIDVDQADGQRAYRVPPDNPLIDVPGARPEIWAYGFRNPWRMSFDRVKGDLWVGDVGWQLWEMIYRVERGGNYGWAITEGPQPALPETPPGPTPILPPTVSHPHSEASSITGGFVYHGTRLPELQGAYIYGDFQSGIVWGLRHDGQQVTWQRELARTPLQLVSFGEDNAGELYLVDYERNQQIFRLAPNPDDGQHANFPRLLSQTGLFTDTPAQSPAPGVLPYDINAAHWADHATGQRWLALPGDEPALVEADGRWKLPDGAVLAKTVSIQMERGNPASSRRLETQVLHLEDDSWRPYTYIWNDEQTDAELADAAGSSRALRIIDAAAPGGAREQTYRFAARAECQLCHNPWVEKRTTIYGVQSASPLAMSTLQWNRAAADDGPASEASAGDSAENQLALLRRTGWLAGELPANLDEAPRLADPHDSAADLDLRARSYLHVNCAHCHQEHAGGAATIDLAFSVKLEDAKMLGVRPKQGAFGISAAAVIAPADPVGSVLHYRMAKTGSGRMPRLGSDEVDEHGVALIRDWIAAMKPAAETDATIAGRPEDEAAREALSIDDAGRRAEALRQVAGSTRGGLALLELIERGAAPPEAREEIVALALEQPAIEVRDLFERFLPPERRAKRLGTVVNADSLLALAADAERGRQLFFRDGGATCKSCHRVNGQGETLGPDLSQIGKKYPPRELLTHLLEPSKFIEPKYVAHVLESTDGRVWTGLLVERTETEVLLRTAQNQPIRLATDEIEVLVPQPKSLMPELLLRDLTPQQAADLLAYLSSLRTEAVAAPAGE